MKCISCKKLLWNIRYELSGIWRNDLLLKIIFREVNEKPYYVIIGYTNSKVIIIPFCSRICVDKLYNLVLTNIEFIRLENYYLFNELYFDNKEYGETEQIKKYLFIEDNIWTQDIKYPYKLEYLYRYFNLPQIQLDRSDSN